MWQISNKVSKFFTTTSDYYADQHSTHPNAKADKAQFFSYLLSVTETVSLYKDTKIAHHIASR